LDREDEIRAGLLNAYLASFRYPSAVGELRHVGSMYQEAFKLSWNRTVIVQTLYETLYQPMLYMPVTPVSRDEITRFSPGRESVLRTEPVEAAKLYESFFDRAITEGEHQTVVDAVRATWSVDRAQTALQAVDDREVYLQRQEISVAEHGDWAEIELYEVYQNQTTDQEEVVYYFTLPESAVITGLWLGNSPDREDRFTHRVSPRGAAQALYRNEVLVSRMDPALVEQIGPTQYRLRAYPVPPKQWTYEGDDWNRGRLEDAPPLYLWMTWRVPIQDNAWPLPYLADKRNVYWDDDSVRLINGVAAADGDAWLPASVAATAPTELTEHHITFANGDTVSATPLSQVTLPTLPADVRLAVVVDRSRSMAAFAGDVSAALARVEELTGAQAVVDTFLTSSPYRGERAERVGLASLAPDTILYYGGQNAADLLVQYNELRNDADYDGVLVLTDGTGYELSAEGVDVPQPSAPVWMVHLRGNFPIGYDDGSLQAIQASGGGSVATVEEALSHLAVQLNAAANVDGAVYQISDGYLWTVVPSDPAETAVAHDSGFSALAARRLILAEMQRNRGVLDNVETLDQLHAIAVDESIVTPYSSMIVLVNQRQERQLDQLEQGDDRFLREYEGVGETTDPLTVTAVPEPEEWLLTAIPHYPTTFQHLSHTQSHTYPTFIPQNRLPGGKSHT
ncbi:MAG: TIGR02921 family PEP-CTERM protein, partial [Caldilineaceae bacterium]